MANDIYRVDGGKVTLHLHPGQSLAWDSERRFVAMLAGSQGGKTSMGPWWMYREVSRCNGGDHFVVTSNYDLFKLKLLPAVQEVFEHVLGCGRYWAGDKIMELRDPATGQFRASRATDPMWARLILRSAEAESGLESATARSAWCDEAGQDAFTLQAWRAILRRLALHRGRVLLTTTLYNLGWLKQHIIDPAESGGTVSLERLGDAEILHTDNPDAERGDGIDLIQFDSIVNPAYPREEYERARDTMPDDEFQMFYRGRVATLRGVIYDCFNRQRNACPRFVIPDEWPRFVGVDPGGVNTAALYFAEEPGTMRLYGYREYLAGGRTAKQHAAAILDGEQGRPTVYGGAKSEQQWRQEFAAGGLPVREPLVPDVNIGISRVYGQFKTNGLIIFDDLHGTLDQLGSYRRKRDRAGNMTDEIENKDAYHYLDALRYVVGSIRGDRPRMRVVTVETRL